MKTLHSRDVQPAQLRGVNPEKRTVDIKASDFTLDSYATRIDQTGWELEQFKVNGPICLQHDSWRSLPVATALGQSVRVENDELLMTVQFPPQGTTVDADEAFGLIQAGILKGVSVGFMPIEWEDVDEEDGNGFKRKVRIYRRQKLLEVSFVTIPANDNGLVARSREVNADEAAVRGMTERLEDELMKKRTDDCVLCKAFSVCSEHAEALKDVEKHRAYFEQKQPINKAASRAMERFFETRGIEQPADELDAFKRMHEIINEEADGAEEAKQEEKTEVIEEPVKSEEKDPTTSPPAEAPQPPEQKASVSIPLPVLKTLPKVILDKAEEAAAKASRRGVPAHRLGEVVAEELGTLISTLSHSQS